MLLRLCLLRFMSPRHKSLSPAEITLQHRRTRPVICEAWTWREREKILKICFVDHMSVRGMHYDSEARSVWHKAKHSQSAELATRLRANVRDSVAINASFAWLVGPPLCRAGKIINLISHYSAVRLCGDRQCDIFIKVCFFLHPSLFLLFLPLLLLYSEA